MRESANKQYLCIDLKSFYASVECVDRGLDPMTTDLVVADLTRTNKTICLAVSPSLKAKGVRNRCRLFQIPEHLRYEVAPPRMARYIQKSAEIYGIYLRWMSKDDIHVYSIDEAFFDVTPYLSLYGLSARELGERIRADVVARTGIPATCGVGPNLYLAKVALDITAKHSEDFFGELDEQSYKEMLWDHRPITDFWRVGAGTARRLAQMGIHTMGQLALAPTEPIYREFGVDAEILIDHAWGVEPVQMAHIKAYRPQTHCLTNTQVLGRDYAFDDARTVVKEMADAVALELVERGKAATSVVVWVNYGLTADEKAAMRAEGNVRFWGGPSDGGTRRFVVPTSSRRQILDAALDVFDEQVSPLRGIHRLNVTLDGVVDDDAAGVQLDLFSDAASLEREHRRQLAVSAVKERFGKNSLLKGIDLLPEATARERNQQIGGHRSG
ncbi:MAG: Y-family DNA polymerase [Coriobacteriales bacterium]|nr:Y-family DNA polymerase [Coriobacteriales bacterium]